MEGTILLKTLTEKSVIAGGKHAGCYVGELLIRSKISLIYSYFHYSNITFTSEVLDKLNIRPEDRISKPGKDIDKFAYYNNRNHYKSAKSVAINSLGSNDPDKVKKATNVVLKSKAKGYFRHKYKALIEKEKISFSKGALQRKNQGH